MNQFTQHTDVRAINRMLFTRKHGKTLDVVAALVIGADLAQRADEAAEAQRAVVRCSAGQSAQPPLQRLSVVGMTRASDGGVLTLDALTEWLAGKVGLDYLRIDPLKVDVGKIADVMGAGYAERHKVLPVQVTPKEVVVATAEPFIDDWVAEVERQARRPVRRVLAFSTTRRAFSRSASPSA